MDRNPKEDSVQIIEGLHDFKKISSIKSKNFECSGCYVADGKEESKIHLNVETGLYLENFVGKKTALTAAFFTRTWLEPGRSTNGEALLQ